MVHVKYDTFTVSCFGKQEVWLENNFIKCVYMYKEQFSTSVSSFVKCLISHEKSIHYWILHMSSDNLKLPELFCLQVISACPLNLMRLYTLYLPQIQDTCTYINLRLTWTIEMFARWNYLLELWLLLAKRLQRLTC